MEKCPADEADENTPDDIGCWPPVRCKSLLTQIDHDSEGKKTSKAKKDCESTRRR
jgi:hypothetical protein